MKRRPNAPAAAAELRRRAAARLKARQQPSRSETDPPRLRQELTIPHIQLEAHNEELQIHQVELEMQNEALRQTQDELAAALDRYTELYDHAPAGYFVLDAGGGILVANLTGARLLGIERSCLANRCFGLLVTEEDRSAFQGFLHEVFAGQAREVCEVALRPPKGRPALFVQIKATLTPEGRECRAVVVDITARRQAEVAWQREAALRGILLEHLPCLALLLKNKTREIVYANQSARWAGAVVGRTCYETCFQKSKPCLFCAGPEVWDTRQPRQLEFAQGGKHYEARWVPFGDEMYVHYIFDITEHKQSEAALRESEARYRGLFEAVSDAIVLVDQQTGEVLEANSAATTLYGYGRAELLTLGAADLSAEPDQTRQAIASLVPYVPLRWHRKKDGTVFPVEITGSFFNYQGRKVRVATIRDITDRKRAEEEVHRLAARLLQVQDEERRQVARELHDTVGQSLVGLGINLDLLRQSTPQISDRADELLGQCLALADRCMQEVRTASYLQHPPLLDALGLTAAIRDHAGGMARLSGLRIRLELGPDLASLPRETELALFRVFQESLSNILRHSGSKTASVTLAQTPAQTRLEVRDRGHGMERSGSEPPVGPQTDGGASVPASQSEKKAAPPGETLLRLGVGIAGMKERMRQLSGQLKIRFTARGTTVIAIVPRKEETPDP